MDISRHTLRSLIPLFHNMKKLLLLGSVAGPCPPDKQGGTERVAYLQAKYLAKNAINIIFVGGKGTENLFKKQLLLENEPEVRTILNAIEFIEIGGDTQYGSAQGAAHLDPAAVEASRKMRLEMTYMAQVQDLMIERKNDYSMILNNLRAEAILIPLASTLNKKIYTVMHLNIFAELADTFKKHHTHIITIADHQRKQFSDLQYARTIYNPVNTNIYTFNENAKEYALMMGTIGRHKNQLDAIEACLKAKTPLIICGKVREQDYFDQYIKPHIDGKNIIYKGELAFEDKLQLYQQAKVFLFPIHWEEPFGLVMIEALSCGTPVIAYPHGGPAEIVTDGVNGFLVSSPVEMSEKINQIRTIDRQICRNDTVQRFDEEIIGTQYVTLIKNSL